MTDHLIKTESKLCFNLKHGTYKTLTENPIIWAFIVRYDVDGKAVSRLPTPTHCQQDEMQKNVSDWAQWVTMIDWLIISRPTLK